VKTSLLTLLLTALGLWAQTAPPPTFQSLPPDAAVQAGVNTNRELLLKRAMQRALGSGTNTPVPGIVGSPANPAVGVDASAPGPASPNRPRPQPTAKPGSAPIPGLPTASVKPAPGLAALLTNQVPPAGLPGAAADGAAEDTIPPGMINLQQADLNQVLQIYSEWVNRTVLRASTLPAPTITLKTQTPLTRREAVQALDAVLALNGIAMVNVGEKFVKAVPETAGNTAGARFDTNSPANLPELGQYVTHVVQLKYAKPGELLPILQPFSKIPNSILPIEGSQMLVLRDYTENVKRMLELVTQIDVAVPSEYVSEVIPMKYAKASEIANALNSLSSGGGGTVVGGSGGGGATRSGRSSGFGRTGGIGGMGGAGGYPGQTTPGMVTPPGGAGMPTAGAAGSSFQQRLQNIIQRAGAPGSGEIMVLGQTKMIADERTNSLLIYASKEDMKTIKEIVAKLDVVLAQVLIEAVIIEVALKNSRDLGFSYIEQQPHGVGNYFKGLGAINNGNSLSQSPLVSAATNAASSLPGGFSYLASFGQDLDVTVTALAADSRARILQRPRIQTSHNEPASLFVGESRPYPTSSYYGGGAYGGYSSIQQMQIGVTLEVTPLINPDGLVVMDIHQKIDSVSGTVSIANVGDVPVTSSKEAQAKVSVRDHDTIILGGLIETDRNKSASGVPLLMDIPLLGYLFRSSHADESRTELIVLIRPTVLPTPEIAALTATAEKNKMPGVRGTEKEIRAEDAQRLKQADKADAAKSSQPMQNP
jgi:general secretion pathway protein D